jgi:hypothetical protein
MFVHLGILKTPSARDKPIEILCYAEVDCALADTDEFIELKKQLKYLGFGKNFPSKGTYGFLCPP